MISSQKVNDIIFRIYDDSRTVFRLHDIALLLGDLNISLLSQRLNYYVRTGRLLNPRKGFYAKRGYNPEEFSNLLYTPSYISLEYVLQKAGVVFQYDDRISAISYLSREIESDGKVYMYKKIKGEILVDMSGIVQQNNVNIAIPEREFLDLMYLNKEYHFDNLSLLDKNMILKFLPLYRSKLLEERVIKQLKNV